jgi:chromosomal replication initiator protein
MTVEFDSLLRLVAQRFDVTVADIKSSRRSRQVLPARHIAAYLAHTALGMSHRDIGIRLGGRDYTNIAMYCRAVARRAAEDQQFAGLIDELASAVRAAD